MASWTPTVSQDPRETEAHLGSVPHLGSVANQNSVGHQDHPEPGAGGGPVVPLDSKISQSSEEHLGAGLSQVPAPHLAPVAHLEMKVRQESVASRGSVGSQDRPEPDVDVPLDSKVTQGSVARSDLWGHQDLAPSQDPQEPKVNQGPMANPQTEVNQSPTAPLEPKVDEDPAVCLDLRVHQIPVASRAPEDPRDPPDPQAEQAPVALTDCKFHRAPVGEHGPADPRETEVTPGPPEPRVPRDTAAKGGCTAHPGTECHPSRATPAPRPCPRAPSGAHLGLVLLTLGSLLLPCARGSALEFGGAPGQWARYGRWAPGSGGQLSFRLKTNVTRALLLYLDDGGNCDFLELLVAEGRLRLRFAIACAEPATLEPPAPVSDGRWHAVLLTRHARHAALAVDGEARAAAVRSKRPDMAVASDLFVGGIPPDVRLSALTLSTVKYEPPFRGWVADLRVGDAPAALLGAQGVRGDGDERCAHHPPCAHGGRCTLRRGEPRCDCTGTGHRGPFCEEGEGRGGACEGRGGRWGLLRGFVALGVSRCRRVLESLRVLLLSPPRVSAGRWVASCFSIPRCLPGFVLSLCSSCHRVLHVPMSPWRWASFLHGFPVSSCHFVLEFLRGFPVCPRVLPVLVALDTPTVLSVLVVLVIVTLCPGVTVSLCHGVPVFPPLWGSVSPPCPPGLLSLSCSVSSWCHTSPCPRVLVSPHVSPPLHTHVLLQVLVVSPILVSLCVLVSSCHLPCPAVSPRPRDVEHPQMTPPHVLACPLLLPRPRVPPCPPGVPPILTPSVSSCDSGGRGWSPPAKGGDTALWGPPSPTHDVTPSRVHSSCCPHTPSCPCLSPHPRTPLCDCTP